MHRNRIYKKYTYLAVYLTLMRNNQDLVQILGALSPFEILQNVGSTLHPCNVF